ncbi:MAG: branched-chain amino acid ABC transporter substrate-binding protein [Acidimicrobiia bacterium]
MLALVVTAASVLAACGSDREEGAVGDVENVVKIALVAPLSGSLSELGLGMRNAAELAVRQANEEDRIEGWEIEFVALDDEGDSDVGGRVAARLTSDASVVGLVGTLNSNVAEAIQGTVNDAGIVMVSPANTNPTLTQGPDPQNKQRPFDTYFRVSTTDAIQGPFAADYAWEDVAARKVAVIHDKKTYGQGLANAFQTRFKENGGQVAIVETVDPGQTDFAAVLSKIKPLAPDLIYYGGEYPAASLISSQANQQGMDMPLMGGDGIYASTFIDVAKEAGEGDFATSVGAPAQDLPSAEEFIAAYDDAGYEHGYSAYGAYAYDAANVIIEALAEVLPELDSVEDIDDEARADIAAAVQATSMEGATGAIGFDEFGDTTSKVLTVYKVEAGEWEPQKTAEFE